MYACLFTFNKVFAKYSMLTGRGGHYHAFGKSWMAGKYHAFGKGCRGNGCRKRKRSFTEMEEEERKGGAVIF